MASSKRVDDELEATLKTGDALYKKGDRKWFNLLADDVTVYSVESPAPFKGRKAYEEHFVKALTGAKRKMDIIDRQVQGMDGMAVVTQTLQVTQDGIIANLRQTIVWRHAEDGWRMKHLHTTIVGTPYPEKTPKRASALRVLNERIATVAADALDSSWPARDIRRIITELDSGKIVRGIYFGIINGRGITSRSPTEGGQQERELAATYRRYAAACQMDAPKIAEMLEHIAINYEHESTEEDEEALQTAVGR